ncbi:MAG: poly-gamma-glutamate biosynthesis protein PgsC [Deltaproteobacteria bacterium]|nr:poly-gamma-glutamate biosynthesis protein PgsC [Deltaproteobacteria bacterium]
MELLPFSIGIGLVVSIFLAEIFGLAGAGLVVPGYLALYLTQPVIIATTLGAGLAAFLVVRAIGSFVIIYGRRRTVMMILAGYLMGMLARYFVHPKVSELEFAVIGFIIPGLIAVWLDRQGVIESICSLLTAAVIVRLILVLIFGEALNQ